MSRKQTASPDSLNRFHRQLWRYIRNKEALTRDNLNYVEKRGRWFGFISSLYPLVSLTSVLRNYGDKKGLMYKLFHWFTPWEAGEYVFFPNVQRFWGARIKDLRLWRSNEDSLLIRQRNMGYAQSLLAHLDARLYGAANMPITFAQDVHDQRQIKEKRGEFDAYDALLTRLSRRLAEPVVDKCEHELAQKARYLDFLAKDKVRDDFVRGRHYGFEDVPEASIKHSPELIWAQLSNASSELMLDDEDALNEVIRPETVFEHPHKNEQIDVLPTARLSDSWMHMRVSIARFQDYVIQGVDRTSGSLIGRHDAKLEDGWYQFVTFMDAGKPVIRYYPCGDKRQGIPFAHQDPQRSEQAVAEGAYLIQAPVVQALRYEKYIAHSELSGGVPVNAAGAFMIKNGQLRVIDDSSGHYEVASHAPDVNRPLKFACDVFAWYGVETGETVLEHWTPYHGLDKLCKKTAAAITFFYEPAELKGRDITAQLAELRATEPGKPAPITVLRALI